VIIDGRMREMGVKNLQHLRIQRILIKIQSFEEFRKLFDELLNFS